MNKDSYERAIHEHLSAFRSIANELGENHPVTKFMGDLAWGRHAHERGPDQQGLRAVVAEYGTLLGYADMLVKFCNYKGYDGRRVVIDKIRSIYVR